MNSIVYISDNAVFLFDVSKRVSDLQNGLFETSKTLSEL